MDTNKISSFSSNLFRFYAKCFAFPYDEMFYELHHLYRTLEQNIYDEEEYIYLQQILEIINNFQGIEFKEMREEYVLLFTNVVEADPLCPFYATDFLSRYGKHINTDLLSELFFEAGLPFDENESVDSIINLVEYFSILIDSFLNEEVSEEEIISFYNEYLINWLPQFCDTLLNASSFNFYKEIADGLKGYLFWLNG
jgi:TorA maturation chaperone TorD